MNNRTKWALCTIIGTVIMIAGILTTGIAVNYENFYLTLMGTVVFAIGSLTCGLGLMMNDI